MFNVPLEFIAALAMMKLIKLPLILLLRHAYLKHKEKRGKGRLTKGGSK